MKVGDLVKTKHRGSLGIVVEDYRTLGSSYTQETFRVYWFNGMGIGTTGICSIHSVEVIQ